MIYGIKGLEWKQYDAYVIRAKTPFGPLIVRTLRHQWGGIGGGLSGPYESDDAAKAAAESWYRARLAAALTDLSPVVKELAAEFRSGGGEFYAVRLETELLGGEADE